MRIRNLCFLCAAATAFATTDSEKLSVALGHMIGKNLQSLNVPLDLEAIAKGLQDEAAGLTSPMSEEDCVETLMKMQEEKNLKESIAFLESNKKREGVVSLEDGKLQFEVLKKGEGQSVLPYNSPLVRVRKEGDSFNSPASEEILALDEAIPGLKLGIVGMREGEIRKLYVHPELAFGKEQRIDPPNSLFIIEVEILKADASSDAHAASNADSLPIFDGLDDISPLTR